MAAASGAGDLAGRGRARSATATVLFVLGLLLGSWAPRIPEVKTELGLSDGQLGLGLLGAPVGAVASMWLIGVLVTRFGSRRVVQLGLVAYCAAALLVDEAVGVPSLFVVLFAWGVCAAVLDIAVNAQAVVVERAYGRPVMSSLHAAWTAGALVGAGVGALAASLSVSLFVQLAVLGTVGLAVTLPFTSAMLDDATALPVGSSTSAPTSAPAPATVSVAADSAPVPASASASPATHSRNDDVRAGGGVGDRRDRRGLALAALSAIAVASFLGESASADWSAVYLADVTGAVGGLAGAGFVAFSAVMLVGRLCGDRLVEAFGPRRLVRVLAGSAAVVMAVALALGDTSLGTVAGVVGFAVLGGGLACVVPIAISAAGRVGDNPGTSVAIVITSGYAGWLVGPPLVGGLAELFGLRQAMVVIPILAAMIAAFSASLADGSAWSADPAGGERPGGPPAARSLDAANLAVDRSTDGDR